MSRNPSRRPVSPGARTRRRFMEEVAAAAAVLTAGPAAALAAESKPEAGPFKLKYAPSLGMFREHAGKNPLDNLRFMAGQGFRAAFDNGLVDRPAAEQEAIAAEAARLGLTLGPFVAYADFSVKSFVTRDPDVIDMLRARMTAAVETAARTGVRWALVVPGRFDEGKPWDYQTANVIDNLKLCAGIFEKSGLVMVIEPLNAWRDHPGLFLTGIPQAYQICRAVGSPCCKIVDDIYHQQITEGNLIPNIEAAWEEIASFHVGDNPGRKEPTTGEINYRNIFKFLHGRNYAGVICMEHGKSRPGREGEQAVIDAYRSCDDY